MSTELISYIKWGYYQSQDKDNPDILDIKVIDLVTFDTEYSVNVQVLLKIDGKLEYRNLPLKSHTSKNSSLLKQWTEGIKTKKIKKDSRIQIHTWLSESKNGFPIRRYTLEF